ncbi:MAG: XRE family transcriptional regulator [Sphingobacteriales bacterium]|nr:MAG: XRE family transcriptional regulator [Sphingobacteriales bacterium]
MDKRIHHGRNIKKLRELQDIKQDTLAGDLGEEWTQKKISQLEDKEVIDAELLQKVAGALKIPVKAIENLEDDEVMNIITNTFNDNSVSHGNMPWYNQGSFNINTGEKWLEALDKIEKLTERLLQSEREKVEMLQKSLELLQKVLENK